jgi:hypothetical protein
MEHVVEFLSNVKLWVLIFKLAYDFFQLSREWEL